MKVAVYSGSFDPLHIGHRAIMEHLLQDREFDCVYLVISPQNPFKDPSKAQNARERYDAACAAVARWQVAQNASRDAYCATAPRCADAAGGADKAGGAGAARCTDASDSRLCNVEDIELEMEPPHYTIRTLEALRRREPDNEFTLVVGADNLAAFRGWKDYKIILKEYGIIVFPREGFDAEKDRASLLQEDPTYRITIADAPLVNVSSTQIRAALAAGEDVSDLIM